MGREIDNTSRSLPTIVTSATPQVHQSVNLPTDVGNRALTVAPPRASLGLPVGSMLVVAGSMHTDAPCSGANKAWTRGLAAHRQGRRRPWRGNGNRAVCLYPDPAADDRARGPHSACGRPPRHREL